MTQFAVTMDDATLALERTCMNMPVRSVRYDVSKDIPNRIRTLFPLLRFIYSVPHNTPILGSEHSVPVGSLVVDIIEFTSNASSLSVSDGNLLNERKFLTSVLELDHVLVSS
jgi:hypothetical protein